MGIATSEVRMSRMKAARQFAIEVVIPQYQAGTITEPSDITNLRTKWVAEHQEVGNDFETGHVGDLILIQSLGGDLLTDGTSTSNSDSLPDAIAWKNLIDLIEKADQAEADQKKFENSRNS